MQIAIINAEQIEVGDYRTLFPNTSFPEGGPTPDFMTENGCLGVTVFKPFDHDTQKLIACDPYIEDGQVFTVTVASLSVDELAARADQRKAENAARAKRELEDTDWCENASVRDEAVTPHLTNAEDFDAYRLALRVIVVTRPETVESWPVQPQGTWST